MKRPIAVCLFGVALAAMAGCTGAMVATAGLGALQTGTEAFIRGELESGVAHPLADVFACVEQALNDLKLPIRSSKIGEHNGYFNSKETQGRKIDVDLEMKSPTVTKINIRVGVFGDRAMSQLILAAIQSRLEALRALPKSPPVPEGPPEPPK